MYLQNSQKERDLNESESRLDLSSDHGYNKFNDCCDYIEWDECHKFDKFDNDLSILQWNIRELTGKLNEVSCFLAGCTSKKSVDIVILVETWLTPTSQSKINIPGYNFYGIPRVQKKGGGVGFLVKNNLEFKPRSDLIYKSDTMENCFIEVKGCKT